MHRSSYGLTADKADPWYYRALCADRPEWTDDHIAALSGRGEPTPGARRLAHVCGHCPVLVQCQKETAEQRPYGGVQAGMIWPSGGGRGFVPRDTGHGPWCPPVLAPVGAR